MFQVNFKKILQPWWTNDLRIIIDPLVFYNKKAVDDFQFYNNIFHNIEMSNANVFQTLVFQYHGGAPVVFRSKIVGEFLENYVLENL